MTDTKRYFQILTVAGLMALTPARLFAKDGTQTLELAKQLNNAFVEVAETVSPSVVVISVTQKAQDVVSDGDGDSPLEMLPREFRRFFKGQPNGGTGRAHPKIERPVGQGSGIILSKDGYILTNRHVVEGAEKIQVTLKNRKTFEATIRGVDAESDVAVIKIEPKGQELVPAKLADSSKTRVGEFAIAIGAPFELDYSVTFGHVSAKGRRVFSDMVMMDQNFIQTDASINPGNSGGPLVNIEGEVIGINTLIRGMNTGIGFAVPINLAKEVSSRLISDGKFSRAWLGVNISTLSEDNDSQEVIKGVKEGVVIRNIVPDGPADKSDLQPADVITAVDGVKVTSAQELKDQVRTKKIGQKVALDVVRDGKPIKVAVKPGELPEEKMALNRNPQRNSNSEGARETSNMGMTVKPITRELADRHGLDDKEGVVVTKVEEGSAAAKHGIRPGDVISKVNRRPVTNIKDYREAIKSGDAKKGVSVQISGEAGRRFEVLREGDE